MRDTCSPCTGTAKPSRQRLPQFPRGEGRGLDGEAKTPGLGASISVRGRPSRCAGWQAGMARKWQLCRGVGLRASCSNGSGCVAYLSHLGITVDRAASAGEGHSTVGLCCVEGGGWGVGCGRDPGNRTDPGSPGLLRLRRPARAVGPCLRVWLPSDLPLHLQSGSSSPAADNLRSGPESQSRQTRTRAKEKPPATHRKTPPITAASGCQRPRERRNGGMAAWRHGGE